MVDIIAICRELPSGHNFDVSNGVGGRYDIWDLTYAIRWECPNLASAISTAKSITARRKRA